jgi:hypothetical protein
MMSDDDSFLSAYMDGQLDPDEQQWVESAMVSQPRLAEQLRSLTSIRDLVAGLSRDQSTDVTPVVLERIQSRRPASAPPRFRALSDRVSGRVRIVTAAGLLAAAAGVIIAISLAISHSSRFGLARGASGGAQGRDIAVARSSTRRSDSGATSSVRETGPSSSDTIRSGALAASASRESSSQAHAGSLAERAGADPAGNLEHVLQFLDNPNLRRLFLVRSGHNGRGEQQVVSVVERTTRYEYFKLTVSQGIVLDPRHPDEATVFALIVNPKELGLLRDQLKAALPHLIEESPASPEIVTRLAGISQVQEYQPVVLADVSIPRADLALRTRVAEAADGAGPPELGRGAPRPDRPTIEQERSAPVPTPLRPGSSSEPIAVAEHGGGAAVADAPVAASSRQGDRREHVPGPKDPHESASAARIAERTEGPDERIVVLVWVCKPSR